LVSLLNLPHSSHKVIEKLRSLGDRHKSTSHFESEDENTNYTNSSENLYSATDHLS